MIVQICDSLISVFPRYAGTLIFPFNTPDPSTCFLLLVVVVFSVVFFIVSSSSLTTPNINSPENVVSCWERSEETNLKYVYFKMNQQIPIYTDPTLQATEIAKHQLSGKRKSLSCKITNIIYCCLTGCMRRKTLCRLQVYPV